MAWLLSQQLLKKVQSIYKTQIPRFEKTQNYSRAGEQNRLIKGMKEALFVPFEKKQDLNL